jgi:hypothetical protein
MTDKNETCDNCQYYPEECITDIHMEPCENWSPREESPPDAQRKMGNYDIVDSLIDQRDKLRADNIQLKRLLSKVEGERNAISRMVDAEHDALLKERDALRAEADLYSKQIVELLEAFQRANEDCYEGRNSS